MVEFSRPDTFLRKAPDVGAADRLHSVLRLVGAPEIETNVIPVCWSNISRLVLRAQTLAGSRTSPIAMTARTSLDECDTETEVDSPDFNCTAATLPIKEPSSAMKLTCTGHVSSWVPFAGTSTLDMTARNPWPLVRDIAEKRTLSAPVEAASSLAWLAEMPAAKAKPAHRTAFIFLPFPDEHISLIRLA